MEPYRSYVDGLVRTYIKNNPDAEELTKEAKAHFLKIATQDVKIASKPDPY